MDLKSGGLIKLARERRGWTQGQLAYIAGVAREEVCRWERGHHAILSDRLLDILAKLHFQVLLRDYQHQSINSTLALEAICGEMPPPVVMAKLDNLSRDELLQVTVWLWLHRNKEQKA